MRNRTDFGIYIGKQYREAEEKYRTQHHLAADAPLAEKDVQEITDRLTAEIGKKMTYRQDMILTTNDMEKVFSNVFPRVRRVASKQRTQDHWNAVDAYIRGQITIQGSHPAQGIPGISEVEKLACRLLSTEELAQYRKANDAIRQTKQDDPGVYGDKMELLTLKDRKEMYRLSFLALERALDELKKDDLKPEKLDAEEMTFVNTPKHLTEAYRKHALSLRLIAEAKPMLKEIREYMMPDLDPSKWREVEQKVIGLAPHARRVEQKVALMADAYYPELKLEELVDLTPGQAKGTKGRLEAELKKNNFDLQPDEPEKEFENRAHTISKSDALLTMAEELAESNEAVLMQRLAETQNMSVDEMSAFMVFCDKDGKETEINSTTISKMLDQCGGQFYLVGKYHDSEPVPVCGNIMGYREEGKILIGRSEMGELKQRANPYPEPYISRWSRFVNRVYEFVRKKPTEAMQRYRADKKAYDKMQQFSGMAEQLKKGELPSGMRSRQDKIRKMNEEFSKDEKLHRNSIGFCRQALRKLAPQNVEEADVKLANMIVHKAHLAPVGSKLRNTILDLMEPWAEDKPMYAEQGTANAMGKMRSFRDFTWQLRQKSPELIADLTGTDVQRAEDAVDRICEKFLLHYPKGNMRWQAPGYEYLQSEEDRKMQREAEKEAQADQEEVNRSRELQSDDRKSEIQPVQQVQQSVPQA